MDRKSFLMCLLFSMTAHDARAGAWTQSQGNGVVILTAAHSMAERAFDASGSNTLPRDFSKTEIRLYAEYGLTDWATLVAQPEWRHKKTGDGQGEEVDGLGRVDAGLRVRLWQGDGKVVSVQASARMPGTSDDLAPANGGDTDWEADARVLYGRGFSLFGRNGFVDTQLGYRVRFGRPADELRLDLTAGLNVTPKALVLAQSFNTVSVGGADLPFLDTREHKVSASVVYKVHDKWSVQVGGLLTVAGSNALEERGAILGIWRDF